MVEAVSMKRISFLLCLALLAGCQKRTVLRVTIITAEPWTVGEAKTCSFMDAKRDVMRCASSPYVSEPHQYLVDAEFNKLPPVEQDWYGVSCRLDSFSHATCRVN
jgi:hypothetical protein